MNQVKVERDIRATGRKKSILKEKRILDVKKMEKNLVLKMKEK